MSKPLSAKSRFPSVPERDLSKLRAIWLNLYHTHGETAGGMAELWFHAVTQLFTEMGDHLITAQLLRQEEKLIAQGLAAELYSALSYEVAQDINGTVDEYDRVMELIRATPEERAAAVKRVLTGGRDE
jgi:hypothetical protein